MFGGKGSGVVVEAIVVLRAGAPPVQASTLTVIVKSAGTSAAKHLFVQDTLPARPTPGVMHSHRPLEGRTIDSKVAASGGKSSFSVSVAMSGPVLVRITV